MTSVPATTFPRFLDLPFEIRWAIYELCLPTRVVDSGIIPDHILSSLPFFLTSRELEPALRYIVGKYSRMPVISRAIPEVYRKVRQQLDPRPILFDPKSDVLYMPPRDYDGDPHILDGSPCWLARNLDAIVTLEAWSTEALDCPNFIMDYCFLGRKHCIIILSDTRLIKPIESIISCGLFGLFVEERTVLVDVDDFQLIDYYHKKLNGQDIHRRKWDEEDDLSMPEGISRGSQRTWDENSPVVSDEDREQLLAKDKNEVLRRLKLIRLGDNGCWDQSSRPNPNFVPYERCPDLAPGWDKVFDEEHPTAKLWLDKLPEFSFAVRLHAQDLEECKRLWEGEIAWDSNIRHRRRWDKYD